MVLTHWCGRKKLQKNFGYPLSLRMKMEKWRPPATSNASWTLFPSTLQKTIQLAQPEMILTRVPSCPHPSVVYPSLSTPGRCSANLWALACAGKFTAGAASSFVLLFASQWRHLLSLLLLEMLLLKPCEDLLKLVKIIIK